MVGASETCSQAPPSVRPSPNVSEAPSSEDLTLAPRGTLYRAVGVPAGCHPRRWNVDRELIEQAQHGDRDAFATLARVHGDRLMGIAQRILHDFDRAED